MRTPRYAEIAAILRQQIERQEFPQGRLPSERDLGLRFQVQRDTVRRALQILEEENCIRRDSRRGTFAVGATPVNGGFSGNLVLAVRHGEEATSAAHVLRGMVAAATAVGLPVLWLDTLTKNGQPESGLLSPTVLAARRTLGIALWPELPANLPLLEALRDTMPLVLLDRRVAGFDADFFGFADRTAGHCITTHLLGLGHRRIGFLSSEPLVRTVQERLTGYREALTESGITPRDAWELHTAVHALSDERLLAFLDDAGALTAVVCANDTVAARLMGRLAKLRRRVPEDVAVTGFGNAMSPFLEGLGLTTMAQPFYQLGKSAADRLLSCIFQETPGKDRCPLECELAMELVVRTSCGSDADGR
jgi:DNA-binding LacI/PurR family transcriptional regulator